MKKLAIFIVSLALTVSTILATSMQVFGAEDYIGASTWAKAELDVASGYGLIIDEIKDNISAKVNRKEFAGLAVRLYEKYTGKSALVGNIEFNDTNDIEVLKAANLGLVAGKGDGRYAPYELITRQQMASVLLRALKVIKPDGDYSITGVLNFADDQKVASWASEGVYYCSKVKIVTGVGNNMFNPDGDASREMAVIVCKRAYEVFREIKSTTNSNNTSLAVHPTQARLKLPAAFPKDIPFTKDAVLFGVNDNSNSAGSQDISLSYRTSYKTSDISSIYKSFTKNAEDLVVIDEEDYCMITGRMGWYVLSIVLMNIDGNMVSMTIEPEGGVFTDYHLAQTEQNNNLPSQSITIAAHNTNGWKIAGAGGAGDNLPGLLLFIDSNKELWGSGISLVKENAEDMGYCSFEGTKNPVKLAEDVVLVAAASATLNAHSAYYYVTSSGDLFSVGSDQSGRLGQGVEDGVWYKYFSPKRILGNVRFVAASTSNTLAITKNNELYVWGSNEFKQVNATTETSYDVPTKVMDNVASAALSDEAVFVVKTDGTLWSWGGNTYGQLGDGGVLSERNTPYRVLTGVKEVYANATGTIGAVKADGGLWMWGNNFYGTVGNGNDSNVYTPVKVLENVKKVCIGDYNTLALKTDGTAWVWGNNSYGGCGLKPEVTCFVLKPRKLSDGIIDIAVTYGESYVVKNDGYIWGCGKNTEQYAFCGMGKQNQDTLVSTGQNIKN